MSASAISMTSPGSAASTGSADIDIEELNARAAELERAPAGKIVRWAHDRFGSGIVLAASFQDSVLVDIAARAVPEIEVVFLDTQYHFAETLWYVERVRERYDLNLTVVEPLVPPDDLWLVDQNECCAMRKIEPLARTLKDRSAWMTGLRRTEAATRASAPVVHLDLARGIVKVNPIATWTDADIEAYTVEHELIQHPLRAKGYASIGCWPCTSPVLPGEDPRAGRWRGSGKTECGLHGWPEPR